MKTATLVRRIEGWQGFANLYKLSEPLGEHDYVIVSDVNAMFSGPETYIFGANADGEVMSWGELGGSFRGGRDHAQALANAGYEIRQ